MTATLSETILNALVRVAADRIGASPQDVAARLDDAVDQYTRAAGSRVGKIDDTLVFPVLHAAWVEVILQLRPDMPEADADALANDLLGREHPAIAKQMRSHLH